MGFNQPWFLLIWIVALSILLLPIIVGGINAVVNGYFTAKEKHLAKIVKAIGQTVSNIEKKEPKSETKTEEENSR